MQRLASLADNFDTTDSGYVSVSLFISVLAWLLALVALSRAAIAAPWQQLQTPRFQHLFFASCLLVWCLWLMRAEVIEPLPLHFLGMTTLTLMFEWPLALIAAAVVSVGVRVAGVEGWDTLPLSFLTHGALPVWLTWSAFRFSQRRLPPNLFIYVFVCGFFSAGAGIVAGVLLYGGVLLASGSVAAEQVSEQYLIMAPLYGFPEAFINGMVMTALVVYRPEWVTTFDYAVYIDGK